MYGSSGAGPVARADGIQFRLLVSGLIALIWVLAPAAVYVARFGVSAFQKNILFGPFAGLTLDFLTFALIGLLSGLLLTAFIRPGQRKCNIGAVAGHILATPIALMMSMAGNLLFPVVGTVMLGWSVLAVGTVAGYGAVRLYEFGTCRGSLTSSE